MGLIRAFTGSLGGVFADQWQDFITVPSGLAQTAALFPGVSQGRNAGRGSNTRGSEAIITNGSKILVPPGYGLLLFADGRIDGVVTQPGGYIYLSSDPNARSVFAGDGFVDPLVKTAWDRFTFGGQPGSQLFALFVSLKELPDNRFGTQSEIYWDDAYLNAQVGALVRGAYTLRIVDPVLFVTSFVPAAYLTPDSPVFDFTDMDNKAAAQLFDEVLGSLAPAFSAYTNADNKEHRMARIQEDSLGFARSLFQEVERAYGWRSGRGLEILRTAIVAIEYDEDTRALLSDVKKSDALSGARSGSFLQQAAARGVQSAGEQGGSGLAAFGFGTGMAGGTLGDLRQTAGQAPGPFNITASAAPAADAAPATPVSAPASEARTSPTAASASNTPSAKAPADLVTYLTQLKQLLEADLITQADYDAAKARALGL